MKKLLGLVAFGLLAAASATAQTWPSKPVTLVVPFPAGGSTDMVARAIGPKLTATLGQPFLVDNKAGATGTIGATQVKRAAPDGTTFLVTSNRRAAPWRCRARPGPPDPRATRPASGHRARRRRRGHGQPRRSANP